MGTWTDTDSDNANMRNLEMMLSSVVTVKHAMRYNCTCDAHMRIFSVHFTQFRLILLQESPAAVVHSSIHAPRGVCS